MECLRQLCVNLFDILKIYLKFGLITVAIYFVAEWYILRYDANLELQAIAPQPTPPANSTVDKIFRFMLNFLIV